MAINTNLKSLTPRREAYKRVITLVSGGFYAPQALPGGQITVYPWDTNIDAWFQERLRQPKRDLALWEVAEKVSNMNGITFKEMPIGDILTILMVSRSVLTDCLIEYTAVCPACSRQHPDRVRIPDELVPVGKKAADYKGTDTITLPDSQDEVEVRVLSVGDEIGISDRSPEDKSILPDSLAIILFSVATVGGGRPDSKEEAIAWYNALSPKDAEFLRKKRGELNPQLDPELTIQCDNPECKRKFTHTLELQRDFFRGN
ncbi:MAG: hypothetical protein ACOYB3_00865 [Azonexus sp.]